jgi:hypothetical protein
MAAVANALGDQAIILTNAAVSKNKLTLKESAVSKEPSALARQTERIRVTGARFVNPSDFARLQWKDHIIGHNNITSVKIEADAMFDRPSNFPETVAGKQLMTDKTVPPSTIKGKLIRRSPKDEDGKIDEDTMNEIQLSLDYVSSVSTATKGGYYMTHRYRSSKSISASSVSPAAKDNRVSVATVRRKTDELGPATSDKRFREGNNFINRGIAIQSQSPDKGKEIPDGKMLFLTGGVEVLEFTVIAEENRVVDDQNISEKIMLKSPADIFYYTGHGNSNLMRQPGILTSCAESCVIFPEDLLRNWKNNRHIVKCLIIAGCSVLGIHKIWKVPESDSTFFAPLGEREGVGMRWSKLLVSKGGTVKQMCGYWGSTVSDKNGGDDIAAMFGKIVAKDVDSNLAQKWIDVHRERFPKIKVSAASLTENKFIHIFYTTDRDRDPEVKVEDIDVQKPAK